MSFINDIVRAAFRWTSPANENNEGYFVTKEVNNYTYIGTKQINNYEYLGFKEYKGTKWKIARYNPNDDTVDWQYAYGDKDFNTAWSDPSVLTYGNPPD